MRRHQNGYTALEALVTVSITALIALIALPALDRAHRRMALESAASQLRADLQYARSLAVARDHHVGVRFRREGEAWVWGIYEDLDGDGVRNDDIQRGVDPEVQRRRFLFSPAAIGVPRTAMSDPLSGRELASRSPVRLSASGICSFSPRYESTNGSFVLTNGPDAIVVQIHPLSARVSTHRWDGNRWNRGV